jgi:hypothetical protein
MSLIDILPQTFDVERYTETDEDEYGHSTGTWAKVETGRKCRLENFAGEEFTDRRSVNPSAWRAYCEEDVDVTLDDRYVDQDGELYNIVTVETQHRPGTGAHHKVIWLQLWVE